MVICNTPEHEIADGKTVRLLKDAPLNAIFVWCNGHLHYPINLAKALGRTDIKVFSPVDLRHRILGLTKLIILDHATILSEEDAIYVLIQNTRYLSNTLINNLK